MISHGVSYGAVDAHLINRLKHSRLGIASFICSILSVLGLSCFFIYILFHSSTGSGANKDATLFMVTLILMLAGGGSAILGLILGIAGVIQKNVNKIFAVLGLVSNGLIILIFLILTIIGLVASKS